MKEMRPGFGQVISGQCSYYDVASGSGPFEGKKKAKVATHSPQTPSIGGSALTLATPTGPHGGPHGAQSVWGGGSSDSFASSGGGQVEYPRVKRARRQLDLEGGPGRLGERSAASERLSLGIQPLSPLAAFEPSFGLEFADPPSMGNPGQQVSQQEAQTQFCQDLRQQQQLQQQQVSIRSSASGVAKGDQALSSGEGRDPRQPPAPAPAPAPAPKRGNYRCSKCGQLKKGHICPFAKKPKDPAGTSAGGALQQQQQQQQQVCVPVMTPPRHSRRQTRQASTSASASANASNGGGKSKGNKAGDFGPSTPPMREPKRQMKTTFTITRGTRIEYKSPPQSQQSLLLGPPGQTLDEPYPGPLGLPSAFEGPWRVVHPNGSALHQQAAPSSAALAPMQPMSPQPHYRTRAQINLTRQADTKVREKETLDSWLMTMFAQLDPLTLLSVGQVCRHWRRIAKYVWNYVTDIKLEKENADKELHRILWHAKNLERLVIFKDAKEVSLTFKPSETPDQRMKRAKRGMRQMMMK